MKKIRSFLVDHTKLLPGVYVSTQQQIKVEILTTFDIRMRRPNIDPVMTTGEIHAIEHIGASYLRNESDLKNEIIYFGPMGCRTGFYLILAGKYESSEILPLICSLFKFIVDFEGEIPGASPSGCGNYKDMDIVEAKKTARKYANETLLNISKNQLNYDAVNI